MKFVFKKLGPIDKAELELGALTIIAGRNNTGKTYVAHTLYGFLKLLPVSPRLFDRLRRPGRIPDIAGLTRAVLREGQAKWAVDRAGLNSVRKVLIREITRAFSARTLSRVFSSPRKDFEGASLEVALNEEFPEDRQSQDCSFSTSTGDELRITYSDDEIRIRRIRIDRKTISPFNFPYDVAESLFWFLFPELPDPFILSAERFGISLFYKELDLQKNRLVEVLQEMGKDRERDRSRVIDEMASRYALPVRDNIDYTRDIPNLQRQQSEIYDSKLFNDIREMMGGYYRSLDDDIRFRSKARKERSFDIPLHIASSSARGLSDLYFFLRHVAEKDQLLIIDEPESHLDTANQIQFASLLAQAVHAGLKVLITTHSDYIVKEINNLLMLSAPFEEKDEVLKELGYSKHDFLKPESVRAYVAEKNSLTQCAVERYGIDMPVFDSTIDSINRVSNELSVRLKYEGEG